MIPKGPIAKATLRTSLVFGLRLCVQTGVLLALAHLLGPVQFGAYAAIAALAVLLSTLATFGTHLTVLRDLSQDFSRRDVVLPFALGTTAMCGATLLVIYLLLSFAWLDLPATGPSVLVCIGLAELLFQPILSLVVAEWHAQGQIARSQLLLMLPQGLRLVVVAVVWNLETSQPLVLYSVGHVLAGALALAAGLMLSSPPFPAPAQWHIHGKSGWRDSGRYALLNLTAIASTELDKTLAVRLLPMGMAGLYAAASRTVVALTAPVVAMMLAALPRLFRISPHGHRTLLRWLLFASASYGAAAGICIWYAAPFIEALFGPAYAGMTRNLRWLAIVVPGLSMRITASNALMSSEHPSLRVILEAAGIPLFAALAWLLTSAEQPHGLAMALACTEWTIALLGWALLHFIDTKRKAAFDSTYPNHANLDPHNSDPNN